MGWRPKGLPRPVVIRVRLQVNPALADRWAVLLKAKSESLGVAPNWFAAASVLNGFAAGQRDVEALKGCRAEAFGIVRTQFFGHVVLKAAVAIRIASEARN